jgi:hypothetical protein
MFVNWHYLPMPMLAITAIWVSGTIGASTDTVGPPKPALNCPSFGFTGRLGRYLNRMLNYRPTIPPNYRYQIAYLTNGAGRLSSGPRQW